MLEMLLERGWILGGETSGHLLALDRQTTGDGIVSALQVLSAMRHTGKSLAELTADLQLMPQVLINRPFTRGADWHSLPQFAATVTDGGTGCSRPRPGAHSAVRNGTCAPHHG